MSTLEIFTSLRAINTRYSVFEPDQVLTHDQLNSIANYLSDQARLSRVQLLGVGIGAGLRVSLREGRITVSKGIGLTTDGDLFHLGQSKVFDRFKPYDQSKPKYDPFYIDDRMIAVYELVEVGEPDETAQFLTQFEAETGQLLEKCVALLFMESYLKDDDLCSGTDCDNLGQDYIDSPRVLMVENTSVERLQSEVAVPHQAFEQLEEIVAARPTFSQTFRTIQQIAGAYRGVNNAIRTQLNDQFARFWAASGAFLTEVFPTDPTSGWRSRLTAIHSNFDGTTEIIGIQYYYDFLKDVVETYNHFRDLLFNELTWLCPDTESFSKHLLIGNVVQGSSGDENRTPFYPSPLTSQTTESLRHAQFLAQKIDTLLQTFKNPNQLAAETKVFITPSRSEEFSLEERAIPYYYNDLDRAPIHQQWNYRLHQRRMDTYNYSYNAAERYQARGGAANPLGTQWGKFSFFRIEGHLGQPVTKVLDEIEAAIEASNLPFAIQAVMADSDRTKIIPKRRFKYDNLHRLHRLFRQDLSHQINEVSDFSQDFQTMVEESVTDEDDTPELKRKARVANASIRSKKDILQSKLNTSYTNYRPISNWQSDLKEATESAGIAKVSLSNVIKTDFNTPFDDLISYRPARWITWLDEILKQKEEKEEEDKLFHKFISQYPALEHFGGVNRGGTFVLVYNNDNVVVADFSLPYAIHDIAEEIQEDKPLEDEQKPSLKPDFGLDKDIGIGVKVIPSLDRSLGTRLEKFRLDFEPELQKKIDFQKEYIKVFEAVGNVFSGKGFKAEAVFTDKLLEAQVKELEAKQSKADLLRQRANQSSLPRTERETYAAQAKIAENDLAQSIQLTADYVASSNADVTTGSDGFNALMKVSDARNTLTEDDAIATVTSGLTAVNNQVRDSNLKLMLSGIIGRG